MTPKEKAKEIYDQYGKLKGIWVIGAYIFMTNTIEGRQYWREVLLELDNVEPKQEQ